LPIEPIRLLGLAFATADLLFEVDDEGLVAFAAGASQRVSGRRDDEIVGERWHTLIAEVDRPLGQALIDGAADAERCGPATVRLAINLDGDPTFAQLSAYRLPGNGRRVSCALALIDPPSGGARFGGVLQDRGGFEVAARALIEAARTSGAKLELGLIELGGLSDRKAALGDDESEALRRQVAGALRAEAVGDVAADLGADRFAVLRRAGETPEVMARRLSRVLGAAVKPKARAIGIDAFVDSARMMRALRFALDCFISDDAVMAGTASLSEVLDLSLQDTVAKAGTFEAMVQERRFDLLFQPVVLLTDNTVHHHEVLVRFERDISPFAMIRMAEELDIIENLDRAVAGEAIKRLRADASRQLRLAVNVSGRTIVSAGYMAMIEKLARGGDLADRLMFELTESAVIDDLTLAQRHVQALQDMGFAVCLDDFGAGAASYGYLQQLSVDVVKIDGAYVRELTGSGRDDAMIRHLVSLCRELDVATVAEMVETDEVADALRKAGVDYAQGWLFGQPSREPQGLEAPKTRPVARRRGAVEQWG
jgi:EAL domain-containing protein (putative c-di-GMP-specific phosphodiesterase class I)/GGDEF domain-containing protein